jgi:hypothetical protein
VERRYSNMDLRKLIFLILLPVCIYGQNEVIRRIEFEDSIRVHSDTLLSHNDRINAVVQLSKDSTSGLRDEINALTDTAGVHLDTLQEHNDRILALLDSLKNIYTQAQVDGVISDSLARFDDSLGVHSDTLESHNNRTLAILDSLKNIYTESQVDALLDAKVNEADSTTIYFTKFQGDTLKTDVIQNAADIAALEDSTDEHRNIIDSLVDVTSLMIYAADYGVTGSADSTGADQTLALQAAVNAANPKNGIVKVVLPSGYIRISDEITLPNKYLWFMGQGVVGHGQTQSKATTIYQSNYSKNAFKITGTTINLIRQVRISDMEIHGVGSETSTGVGIAIGASDQFNGDHVQLERVIVRHFKKGILQNQTAHVSSMFCLYYDNQTNYVMQSGILNSTLFYQTIFANADTGLAIYEASGARGLVINGGDWGTMKCFLYAKGAGITLNGGNWETCLGTEFIYLDAGAYLSMNGTNFRIQTSSGGLDVPLVKLSTQSRLSVNNYITNTTVTPFQKLTTDSRIFLNQSGMVLDNSITYDGNSTIQKLANAGTLSASDTTARGLLRMVYGTTNDRLMTVVKNPAGAYEVRDLINEQNYYSTTGASHAADLTVRGYEGKKTFNLTGSQEYTDVAISVGAFTTMMVATANIFNATGSKAYAVISAVDANGGTITFRVFHPDNTAGASNWVILYQIKVK